MSFPETFVLAVFVVAQMWFDVWLYQHLMALQ